MNIINIKRQSQLISNDRNLKVISLWKPAKFDMNAVIYKGIWQHLLISTKYTKEFHNEQHFVKDTF